MKLEGKLIDLSINEAGAVELAIEGGQGRASVSIPKEKALDSIMALLQGIARASEKPGPAYRMMIAPLEIALERVGGSGSQSVPCLGLMMESETFLRIALRPEWLLPLAERLSGLHDALRTAEPERRH